MNTVIRFFVMLLALNVLVSWASPTKAGDWSDEAAYSEMANVQSGAPTTTGRLTRDEVLDRLTMLVSGEWLDGMMGKSQHSYDKDDQNKKHPRSETAPRFGMSVNSDSVRLKMALRF